MTACTLFCMPKRQDQDDHEEPNAFDLTWRNYLLPSSLSCCACFPSLFRRQQPIRLHDDDDDDPLFLNYNDPQQQYHRRAVRGYLNDPRDWEFESLLGEEGYLGDNVPEFVTRNPFGKSKKKRSTKKKHRHRNHEPQEIFSDDTQDAEFIPEDQIAHLAYRYSQDIDHYGEEQYIDSPNLGPVTQEMHTPPRRELYAARVVPYSLQMDETDMERDASVDPTPANPHEQTLDTSTSLVAVAGQHLLTERLEDLTDKLNYIKQNIMDISIRPKSQVEPDRTTLHTLKASPEENGSDKTVSDLDSIASQALDDYENTVPTDDVARRRISGASDFHFPFGGGGGTPPFASDHHPFSYFTEQASDVASPSSQQLSSSPNGDTTGSGDNTRSGFTVRSVFDLGRKWMGN